MSTTQVLSSMVKDTSSATIYSTIEAQRKFFLTGQTRDIGFRLTQIKKLRDAIKKYEKEISAALHADLRKPAFESYATEIGLTLEEISYTLKNLRSWAEATPIATPMTQFLSTAKISYEPFGNVLVIGPWNYPFQLVMVPLLGALSAGNVVTIKPSEMAPATSNLVAKIIQETFPPEQVAVIEGGIQVNKELLEQQWDNIFFTGSPQVGKIVMRAAAEFLTPVILELGGKSPCIVDNDVNLSVTASRIVWGKFVNTGQTCIAPDYLLVDKRIKASIMQAIKDKIVEFYGENPQNSPDYGRIINEKHFLRLSEYLKDGDVYCGGKHDIKDKYIAPTLLTNVDANSPVMTDEIFGPILPVIEYDTIDQAIKFINDRPRPLALYIFTGKKAIEDRVLKFTSFGGGCVNDTLVHLSTPELPFGGIGSSGMGNYHGKFSFEAFSHKRSLLKKAVFPDVKIRYAPYKNKLAILKRLMG